MKVKFYQIYNLHNSCKNGISKNHKHSVDLVKYIPAITATDVPIHAAATPNCFIQLLLSFLDN